MTPQRIPKAPEFDRALIGQFVAREIERRGSWSAFAAHSGLSRATLYRVRDGVPTITFRILRQLEAGLSLPDGSLAAIGAHDWSLLSNMLTEEMITWLQRRGTETKHAADVPSTSTTPTPPAGKRATARPGK